MFWIVVIFIMILLIRFRNELSLKQQFKNWVSEYSDLHDYDEDKPQFIEIEKEHFVLANQEEINEYKSSGSMIVIDRNQVV